MEKVREVRRGEGGGYGSGIGRAVSEVGGVREMEMVQGSGKTWSQT
jgi:hypothetical protein